MLGWMRQSISTFNKSDQAWILGGTAVRVYPGLAQDTTSRATVS
jgi:hypothetical protein